ncbi:MAG: hypothetical protein V4534_04045 [Myxococcota bacterium]
MRYIYLTFTLSLFAMSSQAGTSFLQRSKSDQEKKEAGSVRPAEPPTTESVPAFDSWSNAFDAFTSMPGTVFDFILTSSIKVSDTASNFSPPTYTIFGAPTGSDPQPYDKAFSFTSWSNASDSVSSALKTAVEENLSPSTLGYAYEIGAFAAHTSFIFGATKIISATCVFGVPVIPIAGVGVLAYGIYDGCSRYIEEGDASTAVTAQVPLLLTGATLVGGSAAIKAAPVLAQALRLSYNAETILGWGQWESTQRLNELLQGFNQHANPYYVIPSQVHNAVHYASNELEVIPYQQDEVKAKELQDARAKVRDIMESLKVGTAAFSMGWDIIKGLSFMHNAFKRTGNVASDNQGKLVRRESQEFKQAAAEPGLGAAHTGGNSPAAPTPQAAAALDSVLDVAELKIVPLDPNLGINPSALLEEANRAADGRYAYENRFTADGLIPPLALPIVVGGGGGKWLAADSVFISTFEHVGWKGAKIMNVPIVNFMYAEAFTPEVLMLFVETGCLVCCVLVTSTPVQSATHQDAQLATGVFNNCNMLSDTKRVPVGDSRDKILLVNGDRVKVVFMCGKEAGNQLTLNWVKNLLALEPPPADISPIVRVAASLDTTRVSSSDPRFIVNSDRKIVMSDGSALTAANTAANAAAMVALNSYPKVRFDINSEAVPGKPLEQRFRFTIGMPLGFRFIGYKRKLQTIGRLQEEQTMFIFGFQNADGVIIAYRQNTGLGSDMLGTDDEVPHYRVSETGDKVDFTFPSGQTDRICKHFDLEASLGLVYEDAKGYKLGRQITAEEEVTEVLLVAAEAAREVANKAEEEAKVAAAAVISAAAGAPTEAGVEVEIEAAGVVSVKARAAATRAMTAVQAAYTAATAEAAAEAKTAVIQEMAAVEIALAKLPGVILEIRAKAKAAVAAWKVAAKEAKAAAAADAELLSRQ